MPLVEIAETVFGSRDGDLRLAPESMAVTVKVVDRETDALADVFSDAAGLVPAANPIPVVDGQISGYVDSSTAYRLTAVVDGVEVASIDFDPPGAGVEPPVDWTMATFADLDEYNNAPAAVTVRGGSLENVYPAWVGLRGLALHLMGGMIIRDHSFNNIFQVSQQDEDIDTLSLGGSVGVCASTNPNGHSGLGVVPPYDFDLSDYAGTGAENALSVRGRTTVRTYRTQINGKTEIRPDMDVVPLLISSLNVPGVSTARKMEVSDDAESVLLSIENDGSLRFHDSGIGVVQESPDGDRWRFVVGNGGVLSLIDQDANVAVVGEVTQAELDAEAATRAGADTALDARIDVLEVPWLFRDRFTDVAGTLITAHTPDNGAAWALHGAENAFTPVISDANRLREGVGVGSSAGSTIMTPALTDPDYVVAVDAKLFTDSGIGTGQFSGIWARLDPVAVTGYLLQQHAGSYTLWRANANVFTQLQTISRVWGGIIELEVCGVDTAGTGGIGIVVRRNGIVILTAEETGTGIVAAGRAGIRYGFGGGGGDTNATGKHFDAFAVTKRAPWR